MSLLNMVYIINKIIVSYGSNPCPYFAKCYLYNFLGFMHKPWDIWAVSLIQPLYENYIPNSPISIISLSFSPLCFQFVFLKLKMFSIKKKTVPIPVLAPAKIFSQVPIPSYRYFFKRQLLSEKTDTDTYTEYKIVKIRDFIP